MSADAPAPLAGVAGSVTPRTDAAGLAERAHRESYQWDAFSLSDDPGVRAHLRRGFREGFMRGHSSCEKMPLPVSTIADELLRILCPEGYDPEEAAQVHDAILRVLSPNHPSATPVDDCGTTGALTDRPPEAQ